MKKVLATLAIVMLMFSSMAFATSARMDGLGVPVWMTDDDSIVTMFPGLLTGFGDLAVLETENDGDALGMVNISVGNGVLSIYQGPVLRSSAAEVAAINGLLSLEENIDPIWYQTGVMYATDLGGMVLGGGIFYGASSESWKDETDDAYTSDGPDTLDIASMNLAILLGLSIAGDMPVDLGLSVILPSTSEDWKDYDDTLTDVLYNDEELTASRLNIGLDARVKLEMLTAMLGIKFESGKAENAQKYDYDLDGDVDDDADYIDGVEGSLISIDLGASKTLKPMDNVSVIVGGLVMVDLETGNYIYTDNNDDTNNFEYDTTTTTIAVPLYIAGEAKVSDAWTVRCGVQKNVWNNSTDQTKILDDQDEVVDNTITQTSDSPDLMLSLGASVEVGDLLLDIALEQDFLLDGPYFISGANTQFSTKIGMSYDWN